MRRRRSSAMSRLSKPGSSAAQLPEVSRGWIFYREMGLAAQPVNGFVPCGLNDPGARGIRYAGNRPLIESCRKRFLCVLFRQIEIPEKADQGCEDSTPIGAIQCFHGRIGVCRHSLILKFFSA